MPEFFAFLAACLQALVDELEIDLADVHEIESAGGMDGKSWFMHINNERFAELRIGWQGKLEVCFDAWYSDYDYLFKPYGNGLTARGMFIATMRHPEMHLLRGALQCLKWQGHDWRSIREIIVAEEIGPHGFWWAWLDDWLVVTWDAHELVLRPDYHFSIYTADGLYGPIPQEVA